MKMKVELFDYSQNAFNNIVTAGRNCYQSRSNGLEADKNLVKALIKADHPPIEFGWAMWHISGISRACADQLRTHRLTSFTMLSQRFVDVSSQEFIHPIEVLKEAGEQAVDMEHIQKDMYKMLLKCGIKREDARYYMGMGLSTEIFMACNFRELRHILKLRTNTSAQWEVRKVAEEMLNICKERWPWLVEDLI
jgi:thymidylate synthase (FAD)